MPPRSPLPHRAAPPLPTRAEKLDLALIQESRSRALRAVNTALVDLHWRIGQYLSQRIEEHGWGQGTVNDLARWLNLREPDLRGFSASNLWRMRQFFVTYRDDPKLAALTRELTWTHNVLVFNKCHTPKQRGFYLRLAARERWGNRELERKINGCLFERTLAGKPLLSPALRELHPGTGTPFKDRYVIDFLDLPEPHTEKDLQKGLLRHLKHFLLELGRDFCFVGSEFPLMVGGHDFFIIFDDCGPRFGEFRKAMGDWLRQGRIKYREDVVEGLENAPAAFIAMLRGGNFGKLVVQVA